MVWFVGDTERVKSGGGGSDVTVTEKSAERVMLQQFPVTTTVKSPGADPKTVAVAVPFPTIVVGLIVTDGPGGLQAAVRLTVPEKPLTLPTVTVVLAADP